MRDCLVSHENRAGVDVVHLDGWLDAYSFPRFEAAMSNLRSSSRIVLDCRKLDYMNSATLGALIRYARRARENGGDMKLAALQPKILNVISLLCFDKQLHILPDVDQALAGFAPSSV